MKDESAKLAALIEAASLILYKFTEGSEDWTEYRALHGALEPYLMERTIPMETTIRLTRRVDDYEKRLYELVEGEQ